MSKRAERRHHYERRKRAVSRMFRHVWSDSKDMDRPEVLGRWADTRKPCSCYACGNPRRHFNEPTVQELRAPTAKHGAE